MKTLLLSLLLLPGLAPAQDMARTLSERRPGQRSLTLTGMFSGCDSAYVQLYHDGRELHADMYVGTFSITLSQHDYYNIKFTDTHGRVKRIAVHELSDGMVEFYIPLEIDFEREGNLVLLKQSHGKPDWMEYDVGMSRPRKGR
jgi:hypothetical protein